MMWRSRGAGWSVRAWGGEQNQRSVRVTRGPSPETAWSQASHDPPAPSPELNSLQESPNGSGHFQGTGTLSHEEQERPGGGRMILDISAEWDLTRTPFE